MVSPSTNGAGASRGCPTGTRCDVRKCAAVRHQSKGQRQDVVLFLTQTGFLKHVFTFSHAGLLFHWERYHTRRTVGVVAGRYSVRQYHLAADTALIKQCYKDCVLVCNHELTKAVQVNKKRN